MDLVAPLGVTAIAGGLAATFWILAAAVKIPPPPVFDEGTPQTHPFYMAVQRADRYVRLGTACAVLSAIGAVVAAVLVM